MSYTPTTWETGDTITAEKLNNMEQGIVDADNAFVVTATVTYGPGGGDDFTVAFDKSAAETYAACEAGKPMAFIVVDNNVPAEGVYIGRSAFAGYYTFTTKNATPHRATFLAYINENEWQVEGGRGSPFLESQLIFRRITPPNWQAVIYSGDDGEPEWMPIEEVFDLGDGLNLLIGAAISTVSPGNKVSLATTMTGDIAQAVYDKSSGIASRAHGGHWSYVAIDSPTYGDAMYRITAVAKSVSQGISITFGGVYAIDQGNVYNLQVVWNSKYDSSDDEYILYVVVTVEEISPTTV